MKNKILIISIFVILLMILMPAISSLKSQSKPLDDNIDEKEIKPLIGPYSHGFFFGKIYEKKLNDFDFYEIYYKKIIVHRQGTGFFAYLLSFQDCGKFFIVLEQSEPIDFFSVEKDRAFFIGDFVITRWCCV